MLALVALAVAGFAAYLAYERPAERDAVAARVDSLAAEVRALQDAALVDTVPAVPADTVPGAAAAPATGPTVP